jgi:hypothetical protein
MDRYSEFFWDSQIISADFPLDPPSDHYTTPFYWIVDANGDIREKLIDYSDDRGVGLVEVEEVLSALLGPPPQTPAGTEPVQGSVQDGEDVVEAVDTGSPE